MALRGLSVCYSSGLCSVVLQTCHQAARGVQGPVIYFRSFTRMPSGMSPAPLLYASRVQPTPNGSMTP